MKKLKLLALGLISLLATNVYAADINASGDLKACLNGPEATCKLTEDYELTSSVSVNGQKELDLNGKYLELDASITIAGEGNLLSVTGNGEIYSDSVDLFLVKEGGSLTIENGTHMTEAANGSVVYVKAGSTESAPKTIVNVGENAKLIANKAIAIGQNGNYAYGLEVTINGTLEGITGNNGYYLGAAPLYINGLIKKVDSNTPTITINKSAKIIGGQTGDTTKTYKGNPVSINDAASPAVYAAGYAKWIINGGEFVGDEALSIKSGEFTINGGTFTASGVFVDPAKNNGNGSEATGAAISVTANNGYEGNVALTINDGEFSSENGYALYEGDTDAGKDAVDKISIVGGNFEGKEGSVKSTNETAFISGGSFNSNIAEKDIATNLDEVVQDGVHYVGTKNKITVVTVGEGEATVNLAEAIEGQTITLNVTPATGYKVKVIEITTASVKIEIKDNKFTMPNEEVEVTVTFEKEEVKETVKDENESEKLETEAKPEVENPKTNDAFVPVLIVFGISLIGLSSTLYIKKKYN